MSFFIVASILLLIIVLGMLAIPLLRHEDNDQPAREDFDVSLYKDQIAEIERDLEQELITEEQAQGARTELQRRLLTAEAQDKAETQTISASGKGAFVAVAFFIPVVAVAVYLLVGSPGLPDMPIALRDVEQEQDHAQEQQMQEMVSALAEKLKTEPDNLQGWQMLGRSYRALDRYEDAAKAFKEAVRVSNRAAEDLTNYGEMLMFAAKGVVNDEVIGAFEEAHKNEPNDPKAWFYLAIAKFERGDKKGALQEWVDMAATAKKDAPWLPQVQERIKEVSKELGINASSLKAITEATKKTPGPTKEDFKAAADMDPVARQKMIVSMVDRLAEKLKVSPDDLDGWLRLGRSRLQLNQLSQAKEAFAKAVLLAPKDKGVLTEYASAILSAAPNPKVLEKEMVDVIKRIESIDPEDSNVMWYLGLWEKQNGRTEGARKYWTKLLSKLTPETVPWARMKAQIDGLGPGK